MIHDPTQYNVETSQREMEECRVPTSFLSPFYLEHQHVHGVKFHHTFSFSCQLRKLATLIPKLKKVDICREICLKCFGAFYILSLRIPSYVA